MRVACQGSLSGQLLRAASQGFSGHHRCPALCACQSMSQTCYPSKFMTVFPSKKPCSFIIILLTPAYLNEEHPSCKYVSQPAKLSWKLCRPSRLQRSWRRRTAGSAANASATCRPTRSWTCGLCQRCWSSTSSASSSHAPDATSSMYVWTSLWRIGTSQMCFRGIR